MRSCCKRRQGDGIAFVLTALAALSIVRDNTGY